MAVATILANGLETALAGRISCSRDAILQDSAFLGVRVRVNITGTKKLYYYCNSGLEVLRQS